MNVLLVNFKECSLGNDCICPISPACFGKNGIRHSGKQSKRREECSGGVDEEMRKCAKGDAQQTCLRHSIGAHCQQCLSAKN